MVTSANGWSARLRAPRALSEMMVITSSRLRAPARPAPPAPVRRGSSTSMPRGKHRRLVTMVGGALAGALAVAVAGGPAHAGEPTHAIAMQGALGPFDSLNPLIVKGSPAISIRGYVLESLLTRGYDEPFTLYGLLAQSVETDAARSYVTFMLDPRAKFSDGPPVTAADVIFSWQLLRDHGRPNFRTYYVKVAKAEGLSERGGRFDLSGSHDRELPLILGLMPILPRHAVDEAIFEQTTLKPQIGSGPYVIAQVDPGRSVTLRR